MADIDFYTPATRERSSLLFSEYLQKSQKPRHVDIRNFLLFRMQEIVEEPIGASTVEDSTLPGNL